MNPKEILAIWFAHRDGEPNLLHRATVGEGLIQS
jgi:hypothetical protein